MFGIRHSVITILFVLFSLISIFAYGGNVTGKVNGIPTSGTFKIINSKGKIIKKSVRIDAKGNFKVFLEPGKYKAKSGNLSANIRGSKRPQIVQNLKFQ